MSRSAAPLGSLRSPRRAAERKSGHFTCYENRTFYLLPTVRVASGLQRRERAFDGDEADDHLDRLGGSLVGVGPASDLIEVVPDPRDLPGALALDLGRRGRPSPGARHRPADQRRERHAGGLRLGPPVGGLVRREADGDQNRAASSQRAAPQRGEGGRRPRPRNPPERGAVRVRRGGVPRQPPGYTRGMLALPP